MSRLLAGRYVLGKLLGRGGMGEVYEASHASTGRRVAVKTLRRFAGSEVEVVAALARFSREARATSAISSPHIVEVLDAGEDPETSEPFMVMELLEGEDTHSLVRRLGPLPVKLALRIIAQACMGLSKAHQAGIIHRDIKPANLHLVRTEGNKRIVKVLDFGVARVAPSSVEADATSADLTSTGVMVGSPNYMSPEQARGGRKVDARADIWALGVVLYKLLTGSTPHTKGDGGIGDLLIAICCLPAPRIQSRAPWVPREVAELVHRALQIDPAKRFQSVDEMLEALRILLPEGFDIDESMIVPLSPEEKNQIEPTDASGSINTIETGPPDGMLTAAPVGDVTNGSMSQSTHVARAAPKRAWAVAFTGFALLATIGAVGIAYAVRSSPGDAPRPVAPEEAPSTAAAASTAAAVTDLEVREFSLYVTEGATVEVDGQPISRAEDGGAIVLQGAVGDSRHVKAVLGGREVSTRVLLTDRGPAPPAVIVPPPEGQPPAPRPSATAQAKRPPGPAAPAASATGTNNKLVTSFE